MAYQVKCDDYPLLDVRDDELILIDPKVKLEVNTVGEGSFTIYKNHPYYDKLHKLKSVFEVSDEIGVIFRGRMTGDTIDFENGKAVDLEGSMAFFNDSIIRPFAFPDDFLEDADYIAAAESGNVVEFFLGWLIDQHNSQVQGFQRLNLGNVTVSDPNNYITRSSTDYASTWETLKSKLFDSALGGYLCIRYENDGNYIDYLSGFELTNTQDIIFGENLLDLSHESDATETYTAIIPIGKEGLTIASLPDGTLAEDIVKEGDTIYSVSAVEKYGWIYAPIKDSKFDDVTEATNLRRKGMELLTGTGVKLSDTIEITAVDLHFTDDEIRSFRIYRNVRAISAPHGLSSIYPLTKLDIPLMTPQNTKITVGSTVLTLTDVNSKNQAATNATINEAVQNVGKELDSMKETISMQATEIIQDCNAIILAAFSEFEESGDYAQFKSTVETQLSIMSDNITMGFTKTEEEIINVDGDMQAKFKELYEYIRFSDGAITLGSSGSAITLTIENDLIVFKKNGVPFGDWDGDTFHTGNIIVRANERAQFGIFAFTSLSDNSLMFGKVG